jgi:hypothetical protein
VTDHEDEGFEYGDVVAFVGHARASTKKSSTAGVTLTLMTVHVKRDGKSEIDPLLACSVTDSCS